MDELKLLLMSGLKMSNCVESCLEWQLTWPTRIFHTIRYRGLLQVKAQIPANTQAFLVIYYVMFYILILKIYQYTYTWTINYNKFDLFNTRNIFFNIPTNAINVKQSFDKFHWTKHTVKSIIFIESSYWKSEK